MSVYEVVGVCKKSCGKVYKKISISAVLRHICCLGLGMLFSLSGFNGSFSPFGVAFVSCVSKKFTLTATIGACVGYFISLDSVNALRYTASVLALSVIMTSLGAFKKLRTHPLSPVIVTFVCLFVTGLAVVLSQGINTFNVLVCFCESAVGAGSAFVFSKSKTYLTVRGGMSVLTSKEITSIIITLSVLLLSFKYAVVFGISFAHIIAMFFILLCAFYGKEAGGAVVGICCGVTLSIGTNDLFVLSFYSLGGLLCGAFSAFGKLSSICAFALSGMAVAVVSGHTEINFFPLIIETLLSSLVFLLVSYKFNYQLYDFFVPSVSSPVVDAVRGNIINKLHKASELSTEICTTLDNVNEVLSKSDKSDIEKIPKKVKSSVCGSCGLYDSCWKEMKEVMEDNFNKLLQLKKQGVYLEYKTVPSSLSSVCIRAENISSSFNKCFSECKLREKTENRIKEIQALASEQFVNVSGLLNSLCDEINEEVHFDMDIASRCKAVALSADLHPKDCFCVINNFDKLFIEIRMDKATDVKAINELTHQFSVVSGRLLDTPEIDYFDDYLKAKFCEKHMFKVVCEGVQFNANGEKYSGDTYTTFEDSKGYFYAIICDGMGTGARAAISSSLAVTLLQKLIMAGFSLSSAINTVNTSLISKSGDECSVTLDMVVIDTYTGRVEFYKCGAQDTLVKHHGKITDIGFDSLPLGIINNIEISTGNGTVSVGDVLVMSSDGVREEDLWQLRNALKVFDSGNVRDFTKDISGVIRRSQPEKNDDFTMLTLAISKE